MVTMSMTQSVSVCKRERIRRRVGSERALNSRAAFLISLGMLRSISLLGKGVKPRSVNFYIGIKKKGLSGVILRRTFRFRWECLKTSKVALGV